MKKTNQNEEKNDKYKGQTKTLLNKDKNFIFCVKCWKKLNIEKINNISSNNK